MSEKAIITPNVLRWARETSKMSVEEVALKMKVTEEKIVLWESGDDFPTISKLEKFAEIYRRPLSVFYLPAPPADFQTLRDFRKTSDSREYSTALTFIIREIQSKQAWISDFLKSEAEEPLDFVGKFKGNNIPEIIAADIISTLDINLDDSGHDVLKYWVEKIESKRIFVSLTGNIHSRLKIDSDEVKGFALTDSYAPFIYVNSSDGKNSQLFTLIHELAHLWIDAGGVSGYRPTDFRAKNIHKFDPVEILCNRIAAEILMPQSKIRSIFKNITSIESDAIEQISKKLKVSSLALIVRLLNLKIISDYQFKKFRNLFQIKYEEYLAAKQAKQKGAGGPDYYIMQIRKNSKAFTSYIYGNYKNGKISGSEANKLLNIKVSNFKKLEKALYA